MQSHTIDIMEIRACARSISEVASDLTDSKNRETRAIRSTLYPFFRGQTADTLSNVLDGLSGDVDAICSTLRGVSNELYAYARRLELADEAASRAITGVSG